MQFGIVVNGKIVEAPLSYTSEKGKYIKDFPKYLSLMYNNSFFDRMYGYKPIKELTVVTVESRVDTLELDTVDLLVSNFDLDFRLFEVECFIEDNLIGTKNIYTNKGAKNMARTQYEQAKKLILLGEYDRADMEYKLSRYLQRNVITQAQYDELIALMDADELTNTK